MGWFNEQIKQRLQSDQETLEDSFFRMASVVLDKWNSEHLMDEQVIAKEELDRILKYFREKPVEVPDNIKDVNEQLEYALRPSGLMMREVSLEEGWQKDAYGPMLGYIKETGITVALLPGTIGYWYHDPQTGKRKRVTRRNAGIFATDALCFYRPLPMKKLGIPDLLI